MPIVKSPRPSRCIDSVNAGEIMNGARVGPGVGTVGSNPFDGPAGRSKDRCPWPCSGPTTPTASPSSAKSSRNLAGEAIHGLARRHGLSWTRTRVDRYEAVAFDEHAKTADTLHEYEAGIAALERLLGKQALVLELPKWGQRQGRQRRESRGAASPPAHCRKILSWRKWGSLRQRHAPRRWSRASCAAPLLRASSRSP